MTELNDEFDTQDMVAYDFDEKDCNHTSVCIADMTSHDASCSHNNDDDNRSRQKWAGSHNDTCIHDSYNNDNDDVGLVVEHECRSHVDKDGDSDWLFSDTHLSTISHTASYNSISDMSTGDCLIMMVKNEQFDFFEDLDRSF